LQTFQDLVSNNKFPALMPNAYTAIKRLYSPRDAMEIFRLQDEIMLIEFDKHSDKYYLKQADRDGLEGYKKVLLRLRSKDDQVKENIGKIQGLLRVSVTAELEITPQEAADIAHKIGFNLAKAGISLSEFRRGLEVETEHFDVSTDLKVIGKIAWAHLRELPDYYTRLDEMEETGKTELSSKAWFRKKKTRSERLKWYRKMMRARTTPQTSEELKRNRKRRQDYRRHKRRHRVYNRTWWKRRGEQYAKQPKPPVPKTAQQRKGEARTKKEEILKKVARRLKRIKRSNLPQVKRPPTRPPNKALKTIMKKSSSTFTKGMQALT